VSESLFAVAAGLAGWLAGWLLAGWLAGWLAAGWLAGWTHFGRNHEHRNSCVFVRAAKLLQRHRL